MKKWIAVLCMVALNAGCSTLPQMFAKDPKWLAEQEAQRRREEAAEAARMLALAPVKKVFLGDFGNQAGSDLVREKLRARLLDEARFELVESPQNADAILTGVAGVETSYSQSVSSNVYGVYGSGSTRYQGIGVLRLIDSKTGKTIWHFEYQRGFTVGSVSRDLSAILCARQLNIITFKAAARTAPGRGSRTASSLISIPVRSSSNPW